VVCEKLDPQLFFCADYPGVRCVDVPPEKCHPKFAGSKQPQKQEANK
jgi:hypothetical protein